jgi:serine/threonine-protein kinase
LRVCPTCHAVYHGPERFCTHDATPLVDPERSEEDARAQARVGSTVGSYRLGDVVGRGGMGAVYAAEHVYIGKRVAVKILHERYAANEAAVGRFLREARAATAIAHPNIVDVADFGSAHGTIYLAMEFLDGKNLEDVLEREAPLPLHRGIGIVHQIASALAAAHEKGIVHSDLKPANIMLIERPGRRELLRTDRANEDGLPRFVVEKEGSFDFVKVLDFGVAQMHDPAAPAPSPTHVFGTPEYMSPEAARGEPITPSSDVYALGVLFYEMLTGDVPFHGSTPVAVLRKQLGETPAPPRQAAPNAEITEAAERLVLRMLAKRAAERPAGMDEVRAALPSCYGSVSYRRDAHRLPNAAALGFTARHRRLTEELDEWLAREKSLLAARAASARSRRDAGTQEMERSTQEMSAEERARAGDPGKPESEPVTEPAADGGEEPILLTERKPIY